MGMGATRRESARFPLVSQPGRARAIPLGRHEVDRLVACRNRWTVGAFVAAARDVAALRACAARLQASATASGFACAAARLPIAHHRASQLRLDPSHASPLSRVAPLPYSTLLPHRDLTRRRHRSAMPCAPAHRLHSQPSRPLSTLIPSRQPCQLTRLGDWSSEPDDGPARGLWAARGTAGRHACGGGGLAVLLQAPD